MKLMQDGQKATDWHWRVHSKFTRALVDHLVSASEKNCILDREGRRVAFHRGTGAAVRFKNPIVHFAMPGEIEMMSFEMEVGYEANETDEDEGRNPDRDIERAERIHFPSDLELDFKAEAQRLLSDKKCDLSFDDAVRAWSNGRLTPRPGYYAGRGPLECDLNSGILEDLWSGIQQNVGDEAARNFVLMVESLKDMSATAFLVSFQHYWANKWRWDDRQQRAGDGVTLSGRGEALYAEGMFAVMTALSDKRDPQVRDYQSNTIKRTFLMRHGTKRPSAYSRYDGYTPDYR